jgi:hypothetical protein
MVITKNSNFLEAPVFRLIEIKKETIESTRNVSKPIRNIFTIAIDLGWG